MKDFLNKIYQNHALVYKSFLFVITTILIVYLFPKGVYFKYDIQKGKVWQYENLYAPFDFAIQKTKEEIAKNKEEIKANKHLYFTFDTEIANQVFEKYTAQAPLIFDENIPNANIKKILINKGNKFLNKLYKVGVTANSIPKGKIITIRKGNEAFDVLSDKLVRESSLSDQIENYFGLEKFSEYIPIYKTLFQQIIKSNVTFDEEFTAKSLETELKNISLSAGKVSAGDLIITTGQQVEGKRFSILTSLKNEYNTQSLSSTNYYWLMLGYTILVSLVLIMLLLFLQKYRIDIFENNNKVTFIFFNILLMVFLVTITIKYKPNFIIAVPLIVLPIVIKAFFDARLGLITHVLTVLLLGFIVPNSFEFIFLQIIAGIVTILTVSELYKRANLFISISQITFVYMLAYFAFFIIQEGSAANIKGAYFALFALNGVLALLSQYLIWIYEKVFGLVSDVSLLELSNTNSKLLRELNEKAPGTFQHSMQVANLAEASANEIGANAMLVRTGALYHDIGKMLNPMYFTENQSTNVNPHNELSPKDSAKVIIDHIIGGIELAKKNGLPERVIDFIRTHHGTSLVYYFYKQQEAINPEDLDKEDFRYPGPIPFSKETAILMMADASEAASKSLKEPTAQSIDELIDKVINGQMNNGQFMNANITFQEIQTIKKVIKKKLKNIYHLRIEYPE
jgi:putative nucleotidyltransferase with HDIG domain